MRRMIIQVDEEMARRVKRAAAERGTSAAQVVRDAVARDLGDSPPPPIRMLGAYESGERDLGRRAGEMEFEPDPWRS